MPPDMEKIWEMAAANCLFLVFVLISIHFRPDIRLTGSQPVGTPVATIVLPNKLLVFWGKYHVAFPQVESKVFIQALNNMTNSKDSLRARYISKKKSNIEICT